MDLAHAISELLHEHREINVPGLGTFFRKRINGSYLSVNQLFVPPSECISFKLEQNESFILADYCCAQRDISRITAFHFIEEFAQAIWLQLSTTGQVDLNPLGTLKKSGDGYIFDPKKRMVYGNTYYGLSPIRETSEKIFEKKLPVEKIVVPEKPAYASIIEEVDIEYQKNSNTFVETILTWFLLFLSIATGLHYFYPNGYTEVIKAFQLPNRELELVLNPKKSESDLINESIKRMDAIFDTLQIKKPALAKLNDTSSIQENPTLIATKQIHYEIIGAAFRLRSEAQKFVLQLKSKGIAARMIDDLPGQFIKVSYGSFPDKKIAKTELLRIKKEINPDAWIAIINHQQANIK